MAVKHRQIRWLEQPSEKIRPCVILSRDATIPYLSDVLVSLVTTTIRGIDTEVRLGAAEGLRQPSATNLQQVQFIPKIHVRDQLGEIGMERWHEMCDAMAIAIGC